MLTRLIIKDFAIIEQIQLTLQPGLTVLTGETGAGKSIILQALALCLGAKGDSESIRHGATKTDIEAHFETDNLAAAQTWLQAQQFNQKTANTCVIQRIVNKKGRSLAFINAKRASLAQLRELGPLLLNLHSQHAQQALLDPKWQQQLLDEYAQITANVMQLRQDYLHWQQLRAQLNQCQQQKAQAQSQQELWRYQYEELVQLNLQTDEIAALETEHTSLAHAEAQIEHINHVIALMEADQEGLHDQLLKAQQKLSFTPPNETVKSVVHLLEQASIYIDEAHHELTRLLNVLEVNPQRLAEVETRLAWIHRLARKYHQEPQNLLAFQAQLHQQLQALDQNDETLERLKKEISELRQRFRALSEQVSAHRHESAQKMSAEISAHLNTLGMKNMPFVVSVSARTQANAEGIDDVCFQLANAPELPLRPMHKVASGGELSRLSLAIAVIAAQKSAIPTLIFDEVDVGISGITAAIVGQLLQKLAEQDVQILCITHLAQVAAPAHQHWLIEKISAPSPHIVVKNLAHNARVQELARLLGGLHLSERTLEHAKEMLQQAQLILTI